MAIQYEIWEDGGLLRVQASGRDDSLDEVMAYQAAIMQAVIDSKCVGVVSDERELDYALELVDAFESARYVAEHAPRVGRIAIVCSPKNLDDAQFWETVAVNRFLLVRFFLDLDEAEAWVRAQPARPPA